MSSPKIGYLMMDYCPLCERYYDFVTNVHCLKEHGITKKEIEAKYGKIDYEMVPYLKERIQK